MLTTTLPIWTWRVLHSSSCGAIQTIRPTVSDIVSQDALSADDEAKSAGLARRWGLAFPADPQVRADEQTVFWLPDVLASTVVLVALNGRWDGPSLAYDPENWPGLIALREAPDGVFIQLSDDGTVHHLWLPSRPDEGESVAAMLPLDDAAPVRIDATAAFWRTLARKRSKQQTITSVAAGTAHPGLASP